MKTLVRSVVLLAIFSVIGSAPALAQWNSYVKEKAVWKGDVAVVDATTGDPIVGAYVVGRNVPLGSSALGIQIVNNDDGRLYDKTDAKGHAKAQVRPFGTLAVWAPGYWAAQDMAFMGGDTGLPGPDENGVVTVRLKRATDAVERKAAAVQAAEWLEFERREPLLAFGKRRRLSAEYRAEARQALLDEGAVAK